ncbi:MAG: hypothetical protein KF908_12300 [Nitrosomonas sp.]|uniref:Uncharacterized protein n=1 Tax=Nitrosomonas aestuarii TaxID=52441 RepID=A0A1I4FSM4_9PROT|nr:hypothetical protein [Nitrosomonas aestuarii]MBX3630661.1 hypothetical protein [Nitrosomonas sp.]SFL20912.1 hypothetical protein SAMN05216302_104212 [Nitrosomonas aestuarii]
MKIVFFIIAITGLVIWERSKYPVQPNLVMAKLRTFYKMREIRKRISKVRRTLAQ